MAQTITINGANFVSKPTLTLTWTVAPLPPAGGYVVPAAADADPEVRA